jgi:hypothetical protein
LGNTCFPSRSTYFRRYRRAYPFYREAIRLQGERAIAEGVTEAEHVAVDKSLLEALGPAWHKQDRQAGRIPAGVDCDSTWGYSEHDGWVQGYSSEVVITATPGTTVFPLLASVDVASASETRTGPQKIEDLPRPVRTVSADSGYDANERANGSSRTNVVDVPAVASCALKARATTSVPRRNLVQPMPAARAVGNGDSF